MMNIQKFLVAGREMGITLEQTLEHLKDMFGIKSRLYPEPEHRFMILNYDQIESPKTDPLVIECRSLILCMDTFALVSKKFDRFFNLGEAPDFYKDFNFKTSVVMEKADGSLIGVYQRHGIWQISTRGMALAEGEDLFGRTFREAVIEAFGFENEAQFQRYFSTYGAPTETYVFEYVSPTNRIVTKYERPEMILLGINRGEFGLSPFDVMASAMEMKRNGLMVRYAKVYDATATLEDLIDEADKLQNLEEGFVVWDYVSGKRIKIKAKTYLIAHRLRGENTVPTRKNLLMLILEGEVEEFMAYFPEWQNEVDKLQEEVQNLEADITLVWERNNDISDQKVFALMVKDFRFSGVLFEARKKGMEPLKVFHSMDINKKLRLLGE